MKPGALKNNKMKTTTPRQPFLRSAIEPAQSVESDDLSRFEGEGGLQAPVPAPNLFDLPLKNAISRRPRGQNIKQTGQLYHHNE